MNSLACDVLCKQSESTASTVQENTVISILVANDIEEAECIRIRQYTDVRMPKYIPRVQSLNVV